MPYLFLVKRPTHTATDKIHLITLDTKSVKNPSSYFLYVKRGMEEKEVQQRRKVAGQLVALEATVSSMSPYF